MSIAGVSPWWRSWFVALLAQARPATAIATAVIVAAGLGLANLTVDFNIEKLFPRDDAKLTAFAEYTATFGRDDDIIVVLARVRRLHDPTVITALDRLARGLARLDLLADVVTVLDVPHAWMADDMELAIGPMRQWLQPDGASGPMRADRWRALLASDTLDGPVIGNFLAPASSTVILLLRLAATHADNEGRMVATEKVRAWLRNHETPDLGRFMMSGMPVARADGMRMVQRDQARLLPLSLGVTLLVLGVLFGRWRDVLLVLSHVVLTLIVTLGVMGHIGLRFSVISSIAPVILVTTGSAYSVQLLSRLRAVAGNGAPTLVTDVFASMVGPLFLANFTTVAGFMSLFNGNLRLLNEFAGITAAGVFIAFVLTITVFPLMVVGFPGAVTGPATGTGHRGLRRLLLRGGVLITKHARTIFVILLLVAPLATWYALRVEVRAFVFDDFRPDCELMQTIRTAEQVCRGLLPMAVSIRADGDEVVVRRRYLETAASVSAWLRQQPEVGKVDSPSDLVSRVYAILLDLPEHARQIPDNATLAEIVRLFLLSGRIDPGVRLVARDLSTLQVQFRIHDLENRRAAAFIDRTRAYLETLTTSSATVRLTGTTVMIQEAYRHFLGDLAWGFGIVIAVTVLVLAFSFRHAAAMAIGFLGNLIPIVAVVGLMGACEIPFKPSTVMIFGIALGLAVDNTIYFMKEYWRHCDGRRSRAAIVIRALCRAGSGMVQSSASLFVGFLVLLGSEFEGQYLVGVLVSFSVAMALVYDLLFVPAGMALWGPTSVPHYGDKSVTMTP